MPLHIVQGCARTGKTYYCLSAIIENLRDKPLGDPLILIVPDQLTFDYERLVLKMLGNAFTRLQILGFTRLASLVLTELGSNSLPIIHRLEKQKVIVKTLREKSSQLRVLRQHADYFTYVDTFSKTISELKKYQLTPSELAEAQRKLPLLTADKLHDLAIVYDEYNKRLADKLIDSDDLINYMCHELQKANLASAPILKNAFCWIDGFERFTTQEYSMIKIILQNAAAVTVTLCLNESSDAREPEEDIFFRQRQTKRRLLELAPNTGQAVSTILLTDSKACLQPNLRKIQGDISVYSAPNPWLEVENVASDILRLARGNAFSFNDIHVLLANPEYNNIVDAVFSNYSIPYYSDFEHSLNYHPFISFFQAVSEVVSEDWSARAVLGILKTGLVHPDVLSDDIICELENYILKFGIAGRVQWSIDWEYASNSENDEIKKERLAKYDSILNYARKVIYKGLSAVIPVSTGEVSAKQTIHILFNLLENFKVKEYLERLIIDAYQQGDLQQAEGHKAIWAGCLEYGLQIDDEIQESFLHHTQAFVNYLSKLKISLLPPAGNYVTVSSVNSACLNGLRAVYLIGVSEGTLPAKPVDSDFINTEDRRALTPFLMKIGKPLAPDIRDNALFEQFRQYHVLTRAEEYLWVSYSLADVSGKGQLPSSLVKYMLALLGTSEDCIPVLPNVTDYCYLPVNTVKQHLQSPIQAVSWLGHALRKYVEGEEIAPYWWGVYNWLIGQKDNDERLQAVINGADYYYCPESIAPLARDLYVKEGVIAGSVTRFESFQACPFKFFAKYGLRLQERKEFELDSREKGSFTHAIFEKIGHYLKECKERDLLTDEQVFVEYCAQLFDEVANNVFRVYFTSKQGEHYGARLKRTVLGAAVRLFRFAKVCDFKPEYQEKDYLFSQTIPGTAVQVAINGSIDRADIFECEGTKYAMVIDYKSGNITISLPEIFHGIKLQLMTYLLALRREFGMMPAAALYYRLHYPIANSASDINKEMKFRGWILEDVAIVKALDKNIKGWSSFLPVACSDKFRKDNNCLLNEKYYNLVLDWVDRLLAETAKRILEGEITAQPYSFKQKTPCKYCDFKSVCQFEPGLGFKYRDGLESDKKKLLDLLKEASTDGIIA